MVYILLVVYQAYLCLIANYARFSPTPVFSQSFCHLLICLCVLCNLMCIHVHVFVHTYVLSSKISSSIAVLFFELEGKQDKHFFPIDPSLQAASGVPFLGRQDCKAGCLGEHMLQGSHMFPGECCGNWLPYALVISIVQPLHFLCQNSTVSPGCLAVETPSPSINVNTAGPHISDLSSVSTQQLSAASQTPLVTASSSPWLPPQR